jgi:O-antigen/teichoic acid export membrane protein
MTTPSHPPRSIGSRVATGAGWMVAFRWSDRVIGLASLALLARLLSPADFGLVGYAMVVIGLLEIFTEMSTDAALIRTRRAEPADYDAAFTLNLLRGAALALLIAALAVPAARFFDEPRLVGVMLALALAPLLLGCENVGIVDFRKDLAFHREFRFLLVTRIVATLGTIALALLLRTYWALVVGTLLRAALRAALSYGFHPMRPRWSFARVPAMFRYSRWMIVQNLVSGLHRKLPAFVVGRVAGGSALAFYNVASEIAELSATELAAPMRRALFPGLAHVADQRDELRDMLIASTGVMALLTLPVPIGLALVAPDLVPLFLGSQWTSAIDLLQPLCLAAAIGALSTNSQLAYLASSRSHLAAIASTVRLLLLLPALFVVAPAYGAAGVAWVLVAVNGLMLGADYAFGRAMLGLPLRRLVEAIHRPLLGALAMSLAVLALRTAWTPPTQAAGHLAALLASAAVGAVAYSATVLTLWALRGRPDGAERRLLALLRRAGRRTMTTAA